MFKSITHLNESLNQALKEYSHAFLVTDSNVYQNYKEFCHQYSHFVIPSGEENKSLASVEKCWKHMFHVGLDRKSCLIGLGGGAITDMAGFIASCYMRGIDFIFIPTTLLGMVDAAIGGKNGINLAEAKNAIGIIRQPKMILLCLEFLNTLPDREFRSGIAEIIKYGVISDPNLFEYVEENMQQILERDEEILNKIILRSCEIKNEIVAIDPDEKKLRWILNWGHTFGHALEAATDYKTLLHGEAISIGMCYAAKMSHYLGFTSPEFISRQTSICQKAGLPISFPELSAKSLIPFMQRDKKAVSQKISLILANKIGKVFKHDNVDEAEILEVLSHE